MIFIIPQTSASWADVKGELWAVAIFCDMGVNLKTSGPEELGQDGSRFAKVRTSDLDALLNIGRKICFRREEDLSISRKIEYNSGTTIRIIERPSN